MRSKNTSTYESQNRNFRYTLFAVIGVLIVVAILAYALRTMGGGQADIQDPLNLGAAENPTGSGGGKPGDSQDIGVSQNVPTTIPSVDSLDATDDGAVEKREDTQISNYGFVTPVERGEIMKRYSAEEPIYSKTLEQYVTHLGADFEAPADTQVRAIDGGTVTKVYDDDKLGITIEIDHGRGYVSRYSNLSTKEMVEEGDVVERGQVISGVGNTALFETLDPEHLHFELWIDGKSEDPAEYF